MTPEQPPSSLRAALSHIPQPSLRPDDMVSRGKSEPQVRKTVDITTDELKTIELHMRRLGIPNAKRMRLFADMDGAPEVLRKTPEGLLCDEKLRANMKYFARMRAEYSNAHKQGAHAGRWVCYDLWTAHCPGVLTGAKYLIAFIDVSSGVIKVYPLKRKADVPDAILRFLRDTRKYFETRMLFADNAKEHTSKAVDAVCNEHRIEHRYSCEYEPWQNAHVEHVFDTLVSIMRTLLTIAHAPPEFWEPAALHGEFLHNIMPDPHGNTPLGNVGHKASTRGLKIFGCLAYVRVPNARRASNISERAVHAVHLGRARYKPGWMFWNPERGHFFSSQAIFNESILPFKLTTGGRLASLTDGANTDALFDTDLVESLDAGGVGDDAGDAEATIGDADVPDIPDGDDGDPEGDEELHDDGDTGNEDDDIEAEVHASANAHGAAPDRRASYGADGRRDHGGNAHPRMRGPPVDPGDAHAQLEYQARVRQTQQAQQHAMLARAAIHRVEAQEAREVHARNALRALLAAAAAADPSAVPKNDKDIEAMLNDPTTRASGEAWIKADDEEMHKVRHERNTFGEPVRIDQVDRYIPLTFSRKFKRSGQRKSRICVQGFRLIKDLDYSDSYSPTVEWEAIRTIFAIGATRAMRRHSCDFANAFCQTEMPADQRFHVRMPRRYREYDTDGTEFVYPLNMSLYGTVQAALLWYENVSSWLMRNKFQRSEINPCVFTHESGNMILTLYVDDVGIWERDSELYVQFREDLKKDYDVAFAESMDEYLGADIEGDEHTAYVHIASYIDTMHKEFKTNIDEMDAQAKPLYRCDTRVPGSKEVTKLVDDAMFGDTATQLDAKDTTLYRSIVGKLMHAVVKVRVDIGYIVGILSRAQTKPTQALLHAALHVVKYLHGTRRLGMKFSADPKHCSVGGLFAPSATLAPRTLSDGDWSIRHSTSGYVSFICGAPCGYASKKQKSIALCSTESEIFAASLAGVDILYLLHLIDSVEPGDRTATLLIDNTGAKSILSNRMTSGHARHIERRHLHLREMRERKLVRIEFVPTADNISDILTKALDPTRFEILRAALLHEVP